MEGVEPTHPYGYQILSLARLPIPPHRHNENQPLRLIISVSCNSAPVLSSQRAGRRLKPRAAAKFTPIQIHQASGVSQAPNWEGLGTERELCCPFNPRR